MLYSSTRMATVGFKGLIFHWDSDFILHLIALLSTLEWQLAYRWTVVECDGLFQRVSMTSSRLSACTRCLIVIIRSVQLLQQEEVSRLHAVILALTLTPTQVRLAHDILHIRNMFVSLSVTTRII